jgi:hypothetical protein
MSLFSSEPLIRFKQHALDLQDLCGLLRIHWRLGQIQLWSGIYTRVDQALLLWAGLSFFIFASAQFLPVSWIDQVYLWTTLTLVGTGIMVWLTQFWARVEQLSWVVYTWGVLMGVGLVLTDAAILQGWGLILINLCPLWLVICALGYFATGLGMRSRTFLLMGIIHLFGALCVQAMAGLQFLTTGLFMGGSLLFLSELQWDMRPPIDSPVLTVAEKEFNRQQQQRRQLET